MSRSLGRTRTRTATARVTATATTEIVRHASRPLLYRLASTTSTVSVEQLHSGLEQGDRYALSRAITLVESYRPDHRLSAQKLLGRILEAEREKATQMPPPPSTLRIGLSGSPGVGKSTFIEAFGMHLVNSGHKVAVLAVDPSSTRTGGSILGDKTRMTLLSREDNAYVRPSPSRGTLGGVARNTNEAIVLCEAAGFDVILVETVGVGQSETMVADMVDMFVLLVPPAGGDELQGLKKGIVELSDLVLVNKADGPLENAARNAQLEYTSALKYVKRDTGPWTSRVMRVSSQTGKGINEAWDAMVEYFNVMKTSGQLVTKRGEQRRTWMWRQISNELIDRLNKDSQVKRVVKDLESRVWKGELTSGEAADRVVDGFLSRVEEGAAR